MHICLLCRTVTEITRSVFAWSIFNLHTMQLSSNLLVFIQVIPEKNVQHCFTVKKNLKYLVVKWFIFHLDLTQSVVVFLLEYCYLYLTQSFGGLSQWKLRLRPFEKSQKLSILFTVLLKLVVLSWCFEFERINWAYWNMYLLGTWVELKRNI